MKSFDEWFEENHGKAHRVIKETLKECYFEVWQAAQIVQRDSDADIAWCFDNDLISDKIRNNKSL
jgi:hypothetical protein